MTTFPMTLERLAVLRVVIVAAQAATIALTWPLWQSRTEPPLLPVGELPPWSFALVLLTSLLAAVRWPTFGAALHTAVLAIAMVFDQTREQPQVVSLALLLWATAPLRSAPTIGALHLAALWFWSGLGKLTSARFLTAGGSWLIGHDDGTHPPIATVVAIGLGVAEVLLAVMALVLRWQRWAALGAVLLHLGILGFLSSVARDSNVAVWPWNLALAIAAPILLCRAPLLPTTSMDRWAPRLAMLAFVAQPMGFHAGCVDAPFAWQVYAMNEPRGLLLRADGTTYRVVFLPELRVPLPPVPRIQAAWFARVCKHGDQFVLSEPRPLARALGHRDQLLGTRP